MLPFYRNRLRAKFLTVLQFIFRELRGWMQRTLSDVAVAVMFSVGVAKCSVCVEVGKQSKLVWYKRTIKLSQTARFMSSQSRHNHVFWRNQCDLLRGWVFKEYQGGGTINYASTTKSAKESKLENADTQFRTVSKKSIQCLSRKNFCKKQIYTRIF